MERAILVSVFDDPFSLEELKNLALSANIEAVYTIIQHIDTPTPAFYVGSGKVSEIATSVRAMDADIVIFDDELSPAQIRNLEEKINAKIIDRSMLILDIFAKRAKTKEAMLEVEMAQLKYMLPRLVGLNESLSRQGGAGFNAKGPGEKKIELDKRRILAQIDKLKEDITTIEKSKETKRAKRKNGGLPIVALVGYTNAGKSATMNTLIEKSTSLPNKEVFEKDMLFATLDTYVRKIINNNNQEFLLVDTVGFVSKLPHHLVNSFKSTLKEAIDADLLVQIVDASNHDYQKQIEVTNNVLKELGANDIPMIYAFNKSDLLKEQFFPDYPNSLLISNKTKENVDLLLSKISDQIFKSYQVKILVPHNEGKLINQLITTCKVINQEYLDNGVLITAIINESMYKRISGYIMK